MKLGLGLLAALILALVCGEVAVLTLKQCDPTRLKVTLAVCLAKGSCSWGLKPVARSSLCT